MYEERVPKYYQLKKEVIRRIEMEEYSSDGPIPSERELMEQYQVSRITVRKAIDELVVEGYLDIEPGMPIILFGCTTYGEMNGQELPIENFKCYFRTDQYKFYIDQVAQ